MFGFGPWFEIVLGLALGQMMCCFRLRVRICFRLKLFLCIVLGLACVWAWGYGDV